MATQLLHCLVTQVVPTLQRYKSVDATHLSTPGPGLADIPAVMAGTVSKACLISWLNFASIWLLVRG